MINHPLKRPVFYGAFFCLCKFVVYICTHQNRNHMKDIECPYCGHDQKVNLGYMEGVNHQMQCEECEKHFVFTTAITYSYYPEKSDCLNDGNHDWQPTHTYPKCFTEMECTMCGEQRKPTPDERIEHNLGTPSEYFKTNNTN